MSNLKLIIDLLAALFEVYLISSFFNLLFEKETEDGIRKFLLYFLTLLLFFSSGILSGITKFGPIISIVAVYLNTLIFRTHFIIRIILSFITFSIFLVSEILTGLLLVSVTELSIADTRKNMFLYLFTVVLSKFVVSFIILLIKEKISKSKLQKPKYASYILLMPICSSYIIYILFLLTYNIHAKKLIIFVVIAVILLVIANITTLYIMDKLIKYEDSHLRLQYMEKQFQMQENHYKELERRQNQINEFYHDMKNYLLAIGGYLESGEYEKAEVKINQASENLNINKQKNIVTGNICLDALLNSKIIKMQQENILFEYKIRIPDNLNLDYIDLCIAIGNALDNAIEACIKIKNDIRKILLTCTQSENYIAITITNTTKGAEVDFNNVNYLKGIFNKSLTTKSNKNLHGYGLQSIIHIVEKNNGNVIIEQKETSFNIQIILYNEVT